MITFFLQAKNLDMIIIAHFKPQYYVVCVGTFVCLWE